MQITRREWAAISLAGFGFSQTRCGLSAEIRFHDVKSQSREFMSWERTIKLNAEQEAVKKEALEAIPAPCCSDNSAYTCCCSCNLARTIWGLSNHMIVERGADALTVRAKVGEWIAFISPKGHSGKTCYTGGCPRPFENDGCGGMDAARLIVG